MCRNCHLRAVCHDSDNNISNSIQYGPDILAISTHLPYNLDLGPTDLEYLYSISAVTLNSLSNFSEMGQSIAELGL